MGCSSLCSDTENDLIRGNSSLFSDSDNENENSKKKGNSIFSNKTIKNYLQKKKVKLDYIECIIELLHVNELSDPGGTYKKTYTFKKSNTSSSKLSAKLKASIKANHGLIDASVNANFAYAKNTKSNDNSEENYEINQSTAKPFYVYQYTINNVFTDGTIES